MKSEKMKTGGILARSIAILALFSLAACVNVERVEHKTPTRNLVLEHENSLNNSIDSSIKRQELEDRLDQLLWLKD